MNQTSSSNSEESVESIEEYISPSPPANLENESIIRDLCPHLSESRAVELANAQANGARAFFAGDREQEQAAKDTEHEILTEYLFAISSEALAIARKTKSGEHIDVAEWALDRQENGFKSEDERDLFAKIVQDA